MLTEVKFIRAYLTYFFLQKYVSILLVYTRAASSAGHGASCPAGAQKDEPEAPPLLISFTFRGRSRVGDSCGSQPAVILSKRSSHTVYFDRCTKMKIRRLKSQTLV